MYNLTIIFTKGNIRNISLSEDKVIDYLDNLSLECPDVRTVLVKKE